MKNTITNYAVGIYVVAIIIFLIVPLPSFALDVLIAVNMIISMIILFNSVLSKEVLNMSSFPTLLLLQPFSEFH